MAIFLREWLLRCTKGAGAPLARLVYPGQETELSIQTKETKEKAKMLCRLKVVKCLQKI